MTEAKKNVTKKKVKIIIGRWQMYHNGHSTLMDKALEGSDQVIVVIGSAFGSRNSLNPFSWEERADMIRATLTAEEAERVVFLPIRDYFDNDKWNAAVDAGVKAIVGEGVQPELVAFNKDETSYYVYSFPQWTRDLLETQKVMIDATSLRSMYFLSDDLEMSYAAMSPYMNRKVISYLKNWAYTPAYQTMVREFQAVANTRKKYTAPYYLAADSVVTCAGRVLLIKRGGDVGYGLWALPGGFLDKGEQFYEGAVRELAEETCYKPYPAALKSTLKDKETFDHPRRSARSRIISVAHLFVLQGDRLPEVKARDDAQDIEWVLFEDLPAMEVELFEDHASILRRFKLMA